MTASSEWLALAERARKAKGSDREIDGALFDALCFDASVGAEYMAKFGCRMEWLPAYTRDEGSILALIKTSFDEFSLTLKGNASSAGAGIVSIDASVWVEAATPALALTAAFCESKAAQAKDAEAPLIAGVPDSEWMDHDATAESCCVGKAKEQENG